MNKYLFIGGSVDGQRFEIPDEEINYPRIVVVPSSVKIVLSGSITEDIPSEVRREYYVPERFMAGELTILFFRFREITVEETVTKLFNEYRPR